MFLFKTKIWILYFVTDRVSYYIYVDDLFLM